MMQQYPKPLLTENDWMNFISERAGRGHILATLGLEPKIELRVPIWHLAKVRHEAAMRMPAATRLFTFRLSIRDHLFLRGVSYSCEGQVYACDAEL